MTFHLVAEPGGRVLDTINLDGTSPVYDTGHGESVIESLNRRTGSTAATGAGIRDGGWSNGYFTIRAAGKTVTKGAGVVAAGLVVYAADTGRVLMLQRHHDPDGDDPAGGLWEFPGGRLDDGETPYQAARREWHEETGLTVPAGKITGSWEGKNGIYHGFVLTIPHETDLPILDGRADGANPDDPDGDETEAVAWWSLDQIKNNPAVRPEVSDNRKRMIRAVQDGNRITKAAMATITVDKCLTCGCDMPHEDHGDHRHITLEDLEAAADAAGITLLEAWQNLRAGTPAAVSGGEPEIVKVDEGAAGDFKARHLIRWFNEGADGKIDWGGPGDLSACHAEASKHMPSDKAWGFCNNRHHDVLGTWNNPDKTMNADLIKVGPKGYIHGWIHVGVPDIGDHVFHPTHGHGTVHHVDEHGHVHVTFGSGKVRSFQHTGGQKGGLTRRSEAGNDVFTTHLKAAAAANRRKDHAAAAEHYRRAADAATHPKIKAEMLARADRDAAKAPVEIGHRPGSGRFSPQISNWANKVRETLPKTHQEWADAVPRDNSALQAIVRDRHEDQIRRVDALELQLQTLEAARPGTFTRSELIIARDDVRVARNELQIRKEALDRAMAERGPKAYPIDAASGQKMPGPVLDKHLDRVMDVGRYAMNEIHAEFDADPELKRLRKAVADWDAEGDALRAERKRVETLPRDTDWLPAFRAANHAVIGHHMGPNPAVEVRRREAAIIRQMIEAHRPFGGVTHDNAKAGNGPLLVVQGLHDALDARDDWKDRLTAAEKSYPDSWLQMSKDHGALSLISTKRAFYNDSHGALAMPVAAQDSATYDGAYKDYTDEVTVHELGHRMEKSVPGLTHMEFAFVRRAATKNGVVEKPQPLRMLIPASNYDDSEVGIKDEFADAYVGKTYEKWYANSPETAPWEAFQTGTQDLFGRSTRKLGNDELQAFTLGALLTLG